MAAALLVAGPIVATILVRLTETSLQCQVPSAMTNHAWPEGAVHDAHCRGLRAPRPLLHALARPTGAFRDARWSRDIAGEVSLAYRSDVT
jgi:hypothetical protein